MIDDAAYSGMTINGDTSPSLPLSPTSMIHSQSDDDPNLPYAIFSPSVSSGGGGREYNWGEANVAEHSDLDMLRKAILDVHAKVSRNAVSRSCLVLWGDIRQTNTPGARKLITTGTKDND